MTAIKWAVDSADRLIMIKILDRALALRLYKKRDRVDRLMDIVAVHLNDTPLELQRWLDADDFNFVHDFMGIVNCLDRETGRLTRFFVPRFARHLDPPAQPDAEACVCER